VACTFSLQLSDGSEMRPLGTLEDVHIKIGDFWVLEDSVIANITENDDAQIIPRRPFLATSGCIIHVKWGRITFEVGVVILCFVL